MPMRVFQVVLLTLATGSAYAGCPSYTNCADCLSPDNGLDCGWCSPDPAVYGNGTQGTQCMDHTSSGWNCFNLYMHDGCVQGYTCDSSSGQCVLAAAGEGDTYDNCMESCSETPPPSDTYTCDVTSFTCVLANNSYDQSTCDGACSDNTPSNLVGLWRGLDVQTGFKTGEWVMNFTSTSVAWGELGNPESVIADVAIVAPMLLRLTVTSPSDRVGDVVYASYTNPGYPTGPETSSMSIAIQADGTKQAPPTNVLEAMGDDQFDVFVMNMCNGWDTATCDFSPAFAEAAALIKLQDRKKAQVDVGDDECLGYSDCDSCLADASGVCGWCDGVITDTDGNVVCGDDGNGCCGGSDGFSQCNVAFRKTCPVICDYTNWTDPSCRAATTPEYLTQTTYAECDDMPWCTSTIYNYCDLTDNNCKVVYTEEDCEAAPDCDPQNPVCDSSSCSQTSYVWCDSVLGCQSTTNKTLCAQSNGCDPDSDDSTCDPTQCTQPTYYMCDQDTLQCTEKVGIPSGPYYNTSDDCTAACVNSDLSGVWRALRVDDGFVADEWDFEFGVTSVTYKSKSSGTTYSGSYVVGNAISSSQYTAASFTVTLNDGTSLQGIISNDRGDSSALGPVTKFMYIGLPLSGDGSTDSFDDSMSTNNQEFVLIACLDNGIEQGCDFSSASPSS